MSNSYRLILYSLILSLLLCGGTASARTWWVATNGSDANSGTEASPLASLGEAVQRANNGLPMDTVMVKPGSYFGAVTVERPVVIMSEQGAEVTSLNGNLLGVPITYQLGASVEGILDGFTILRGSPVNVQIFGNIELGEVSVEIRNCRILQNQIPTGAQAQGGGIYMSASRSKIHDNFFTENRANDGGAIYSIDSSPQVWNNDFVNNESTTGEGGAVYIGFPYFGERVLYQNNIFRSNHSNVDGGAIFCTTELSDIVYNLFYQNSCTDGYGAFAMRLSVPPNVANNIFVENLNYAVTCGFFASGGMTFANNAFYNNQPGHIVPADCYMDGDTTFTDSNVVDINPQFVDEANFDFHLQPSSGLIDQGQQLSLDYLSVDYDGYPRQSGAASDIGPFEYVICDLIPNFDHTPLQPCIFDIVTFTNLSDGFYEYTIWDYGNGDVDTIPNIDLPVTPTTTYQLAGSYEVAMTLVCPTDTTTYVDTVEVSRPPDATPLADVQLGCVPLTVSFFYEDSLTESTDQWDFGDGDLDSTASPVHEFAQPGMYTVVLQRTNFCGTDVDSITVSVQEVPMVSFTTPSLGDAPYPVALTASSEQNLTSVEWDFGDGNTGVSFPPDFTVQHVYEVPGIFTPSAIGVNDCGEGPEFTATNPIQVRGFELEAVSADSADALLKTYRFFADSLFGLYGRTIHLSGIVQPANPRRGTVQVSFADSQLTVLDTTTVSLALSRDLAVGDYLLRVIGKPLSNSPADTMEIPFYSKSESMCSITPQAIDYDTVVVDSVQVDSVRVTNTSPFISLTLKVLDVTSSSPQFVPLNTTSPDILSGGSFWLKVEFRPEALQNYGGVITIRTNDPRDTVKTVQVNGVGGVERQPPLVESTTVTGGPGGAYINTSIEIMFSEPLDTSPQEGDYLQVFSQRLGAPMPGEVVAELVNDKTRWTYLPDNDFPPFDTVDVAVSGAVADLVGNSLDGNNNGIGEGSPVDDFTFNFTVGPSVYPGDCNNDGIVNEIDVLPIAVYFETQGPARPSSATNWGGHAANLWNDPKATYADADGNGVINEADIMVIGANWGSTHQWSSPTLSVDYDFSAHQEAFTRLRRAMKDMEGSDVGEKMIQVLESFSGDLSLPTGYSLWQNHPNPFNPETRISYTLPEATHVRLTVHNILGQTVRELVDESQAPGFKYVIWDGTDQSGRQVSSGVYFYRLETDHYLEIRKMMKIQ